jgi:hypothetical protein
MFFAALLMSPIGTKPTSKSVRRMSAIKGECVAKLFSRPERAILIQGRAQARNVYPKTRSVGFDNCAFAAQQRVLQHNQGVNRT